MSRKSFATHRVLFGLLLCSLSGAGVLAEAPLSIGKLRYVTLVVPDQNAALHWYTEKLGFVTLEDQTPPVGGRWLVIAPAGQTDVGIILYANATNHLDEQTFQREWPRRRCGCSIRPTPRRRARC